MLKVLTIMSVPEEKLAGGSCRETESDSDVSPSEGTFQGSPGLYKVYPHVLSLEPKAPR